MNFDKYFLIIIPVVALAVAYWKFGVFRMAPQPDAWVRDFLVRRDQKWHVVYPDPQGVMVTIKTFPEVEYKKAADYVLHQGKAGLNMMVRSGAMNRKTSRKKRK